MLAWFGNLLEILVGAINVDNPAGLVAICLLAVMADIGIPFPFLLDTILFVTVFKTGFFSPHVFLVLLMLMVGRFIGTSFVYGLGYTLGFKIVDWLGKRWHRFQKYYNGIKSKTGKWVVLSIIIGRLTPGFMQMASLSAGALRISYLLLALAIILTSVIYDGIIIALGWLARIGFKDITPEMSVWVVLGFIIILVLVLIAIRLIQSKRKRPSSID